MFIKTKNGSIVNMDKVVYAQVVKYINVATLDLHMDNLCIEAYKGTVEDVEEAFQILTEGLMHGASLIDYSK